MVTIIHLSLGSTKPAAVHTIQGDPLITKFNPTSGLHSVIRWTFYFVLSFRVQKWGDQPYFRSG